MADRFRPEEILRVLEEHGVRYVLIGGLAAALYGSAHITTDLDIAPEDGVDNLGRLSAALKQLRARIRADGEPEGLPFDHDGESLARAGVWSLTTVEGDLDVTLVPSGTRGYKDLARDAVVLTIKGVRTHVASLADIIRSKEAAGRPKDQLVLPALRRILEEGGSIE